MRNRIPNTALLGNAGALFVLVSKATPMGHVAHSVTTKNHDLAQCFYESALDVDFEPDMTKGRGTWTVGFVCDDTEVKAVVATATAARRTP